MQTPRLGLRENNA